MNRSIFFYYTTERGAAREIGLRGTTSENRDLFCKVLYEGICDRESKV